VRTIYQGKSSAFSSVAVGTILGFVILVAAGLFIGLSNGYLAPHTTTITASGSMATVTETSTITKATTITGSNLVTTITTPELTTITSGETTTATTTATVTDTPTATLTAIGPTTTVTTAGPTTTLVSTTTTTIAGPTTTQSVTTTQTVTTSTTAGNLVLFSIDSLVLNATTDSWTLEMTNYNSNNWSISATLTATSGGGGSATTDSTIPLYPFAPGVKSGTASGVGPTHLVAGNNYCVSISGVPVGTTVAAGDWDWTSCFIQAVK
jgi:hypothetical protein